jgi:serine/threonine protein phosphatase PrpC
MVSQQLPGQDKQQEESKEAQSGSLAYAACTDPGCERESNEDRFLVVSTNNGAGYFVFDGMGGQPGGDAAAEISAETIRAYLEGNDQADVAKELEVAVELAQKQLLMKRRNPAMSRMGTTVVGALIRGSEVALAGIGDSRAYHISNGAIKQLSSDHTLVQQLVELGQITPHDALLHPQSHILTRCLGSELDFRVDHSRYWIWPESEPGMGGDTLLFCSDGLYGLVSDEEILTAVVNMQLQLAARALVQLARERGGFDNITVVVVPLAGRLMTTPPPIIQQRVRLDTAPLRAIQAFLESYKQEKFEVKEVVVDHSSSIIRGLAVGIVVALGLVLYGLLKG